MSVAMLRENFIKARKMQRLVQTEKKVIDEAEPITEMFMDILFWQIQNDVSRSQRKWYHGFASSKRASCQPLP